MIRVGVMVAVLMLALCKGGCLGPPPTSAGTGGQTALEGSGIRKSSSRLTFDPSACVIDEETLDWSYGSVSVRVLGLIDDRCVFEYTHEMEGGYAVYRVHVSTDNPEVVIREARPTRGGFSPHRIETSFSLEGAELLRRGNVFVDARRVPAWIAEPIPESDAVLYFIDMTSGNGAEVDSKSRVRVRATIFGDAEFTKPLATTRDQLVWSMGTEEVGRGVETALKGMRVAGVRRAMIRADMARGLSEWMVNPPPGGRVYVELELVEVQ